MAAQTTAARPSLLQAILARRHARSFLPGRIPVYAIGIYTGPSPLALRPATGIQNPVLTRESVTDRYATFVADPFMIRVGGTWHLFFESLNWEGAASKGDIALATSQDGLRWRYDGVVLAEPFHLSYPYVFASGSDHYMVPESSAAGGVRLYRADPFPRRWTFVKELVRGPVHLDSSVFEHEGRWFMLTQTDEERGTLRLFHAGELTGPWAEHPRSPVVNGDLSLARPAGRVIGAGGRLYRFAQDVRAAYGSAVTALEITRLTPTEYQESAVGQGAILGASGHGWNATGMHHVDAHQLPDGTWIACVDGWVDRVRRPREMAVWAAGHVRRLVFRRR